MRHNTSEYALIAAALTGSPEAKGSDWDWDETIRIAACEDVLPSLYRRLSAPADISDALDGIHELNTQRNTQLLAEVESLAVMLNQAGIEPVLLKGVAYLITGVYPDPADRFLHDIDFLIGPAQGERAFETIRRDGYEPYVPNPTAYVLHHYPTLTKLHRVPVEIHKSLTHGSGAALLTAEEVVERSAPVRLGAAIVRIPVPEHMMTHLVVHSQMQHGAYDRIWPSLRAMHDLVLLERRFRIDWDAIRRRFDTHGRMALLELHLRQVEQALGTAPPFTLGSGGIRWWYRQALWRETRLRYIDPFYICSRTIWPKIRLAWKLLQIPIGRKYVFSTLLRKSFYRRLLDDIVHC
jgi:hypothetical protein